MHLDKVNEQSTARLTVEFLDLDEEAAAPSSVTYRVDDLESGKEVRADTSASAASEVEIVLTPDDNEILDSTKEYEIREVTVTAAYGANDKLVDKYRYRLNNLRFIG